MKAAKTKENIKIVQLNSESVHMLREILRQNTMIVEYLCNPIFSLESTPEETE